MPPPPSIVMPGLVPGIHVFLTIAKTWMAGHRRAEATPFFERLCPAMQTILDWRPPYSTALPNLFDFGRPCASRPASARLPRQSANSFSVMLCSRPDESFQVSPVLESKTVTSESAALVYF